MPAPAASAKRICLTNNGFFSLKMRYLFSPIVRGSKLPEQRMQNRRRVARTRIKRNVRIIPDRRTPAIPAIVQNLTAGGACLSVPTALGLPMIFELSFDGCRMMRQCRTVWRSERQVGIVFTA
jgi:hypothetical protein